MTLASPFYKFKRAALILISAATVGSSEVVPAELNFTNEASGVVLTNISAVRKVAGNPDASHAVHLNGVVLWVSATQDRFILQDETGGITIKQDKIRPIPVQPAEWLSVTGDCLIEAGGIIAIPVIDNDGIHSSIEKSGSFRLSAGLHPICVEWFNGPVNYDLAVDFSGPSLSRRPIPDRALFRRGQAAGSRINGYAPGLNYSCYEGEWMGLPDFSKLTAVTRGETTNFTLQVRTRDASVGLVFDGYLKIPQAGDYTFWLRSDDGARLRVGQPLRVTKLGEGRFPAPHPISAGHFAAPELESQWVTVEGVVTRVQQINPGVSIELAAGTDRIHLTVETGDYVSLKKLLQAHLKAAGIYRNAFDINGQAVPALLVPKAGDMTSFTPVADFPAITVGTNEAGQPLLEKAIQIKSLSRAEAQRGYPVRIRGVITARSGTDFVIQDSTWSVYCYWNGKDGQQPEIGDYWEIEGRSAVDFAPSVVAARVTYLRAGILPEPIRPTEDELVNGSLDTQYVEMQGIATAVKTNAMTLLTRQGKMMFSGLDLPKVDGLEGALVHIRGVCVPNRDTNQMILTTLSALKLFNSLVSIDEPAPVSPFDIPLKRISDLLFFDARADALHRVRTAGQVTASRPGEYFLVADGIGFRIELSEPVKLQSGDLVEVVGLPYLNGPSPVLREALLKVTGHAPLPKARKFTENAGLNGKLDANVLSLESRLLSVSADRGEKVLELQSGTRSYLARLVNPTDVWPNVQPGSLLEVTGVYAAKGQGKSLGRDVESFDLLVNSPADIRVLARPSWWTFRHTLAVLGGMLTVILAACIWIVQLRRQVEDRSARLAAEIKAREQAEYQRALEAERTRIAQDLHDELGATLTEICFLGAVKSRDSLVPEATRSQLREVSEKSHQMVSSLDEIVWAVNPANDSLPNLANYLCHVSEEFFRAAEMRCRLDVDQTLPPVTLISEVRHNLYLVVREALNNVVKHSQATEVWLRIHWQDGVLEIVVEDNGIGRVLSANEGPRNGLTNMAQRIKKNGGLFEYDARPGQGTRCRIHLPLALK